MWSTIGVIAAFVAIIVLVTRKVSLGSALLVGSFIAALSTGLNPWEFIVLIGRTLVQPGTINLVITLVLISILGSLMKQLGILDKMVDALEKVLRNAKTTIMVVPSLMGTLLVTGGAIMSAPMVDTVGDRLQLCGERRSAINLLYRHIWHFIFPFTPTFIMVKEIAHININQLLLIQLPLTIVGVWSGYHAWLRDARALDDSPAPAKRVDYLNMLRYTSPIWSSLVLALVFGVPFQFALIPGIMLALFFGSPEASKVPMLMWKGIQMPIVLSGVGIMVFKEVLASGNALDSLTGGLLGLGLPLGAIVLLLPALVGLVAASSASAVGITLPILLPAMQQSGHLALYCAGVYSAAYLGYFVSPLHLCQVLTLEYFKVKVNQLYRIYLLPMVALWVTLLAIMFFGRWFI